MSQEVHRSAASHVAADRDFLIELCLIAVQFEGLFRRANMVGAADAALDLFEELEYELALLYASDEGEPAPLSLSSS